MVVARIDVTYCLDCTTNLEREVEAAPSATGELVDDLEVSNRRLNESSIMRISLDMTINSNRFTWFMVARVEGWQLIGNSS